MTKQIPILAASLRDHHNVVNLHSRWVFCNDELKSQVEGIDRCRERYSVVGKVARSMVASIHCIHRLMIEHHSDKPLRPSAFIEKGPECQNV